MPAVAGGYGDDTDFFGENKKKKREKRSKRKKEKRKEKDAWRSKKRRGGGDEEKVFWVNVKIKKTRAIYIVVVRLERKGYYSYISFI